MKFVKAIFIMATVAALLAVTGCGTTAAVKGSGIKGEKPEMAASKAKIVDYQGAAFGTEIPEWVIQVAQGEYSESALSKVMPDLKGRKIFVTMADGDNLEFVKQWTDLVDVETQVGDTMQRVVGKVVQASEDAKAKEAGKEFDPTEVSRKLKLYKEAVAAVEINGLEKTASYWVEKQSGSAKDGNNKDVFEYYAVWSMDKSVYDAQLNAALQTVKDNTSESENLKKMLKDKLSDLVLTSNDLSAENTAD
ncbi:MAG: hypothetical protein WCR31_00725 [Treponema sp.]